MRVGFSPTSSISTREPGNAAAATIQNAADEKSPGIDNERPRSAWPPASATADPRRSTAAPKASSARSV